MTNLSRPKGLDDIIGQEKIVQRMKIIVESSIERDDTMGHMIADGPPGLGKTTLAMAIAHSRGVKITIANGGNLTSIKAALPYIMQIEKSSILFIDEIHRLPAAVEEWLYPIMEDFRMDVGKENQLSMSIPKFTMIGATTEAGSLAKPLYDRFTYKFQLKTYNIKSLVLMIVSAASQLGLKISKEAAISLALRSRGTPRIANGFVIWLRDYCQSKGSGIVTEALVDEGMTMIGIDQRGITDRDRTYLKALKGATRPLGLRSLADITNVDVDTIINTIEPYLLQLKLINRTPKGRVIA